MQLFLVKSFHNFCISTTILQEFFNINATTGVITTTVVFDYESHPNTMDVYVTASNTDQYLGVP